MFTIADGYELAYVSVAGNSSGNRQPGASFLLSSSGGSMVYYFKRSAPVSVTYTLSYNANGGNGAPSAQRGSSTTGSYTFTIPNTTPTKSGNTFLGWSMNQNATVPSYYPGSRITVTGATTLYAVWEAVQTASYTLRFDANGGNGAPADMTGSNTGTSYTFTIPNTTPTKTGFTFKGWATSQTATEPAYQPNSSIVVSSGVTTLYAVWEAVSTAPVPTESITVSKVFKGLTVDEIPEDFSIEYTAVNKKDSQYSVSKTLTLENFEDFDPDTMTLTWKAPHYYKTGGSDITIKENGNVAGYTYETATSKGSVNNDTHTVTVTYSTLISADTLTLTNTYTPATVTPDKELTGITKTRITSENADTVPADINKSAYNLERKPQIAEKENSLTLLYKITITGNPEAEYIMTDDNADPINGYPWSGKIGASGTVDIYVSQVVSLETAASSTPAVNVAHVAPGAGTGPSDGLDSNTITTRVYGNISVKKTPVRDGRNVAYSVKVINTTGINLSSVTLTDVMDDGLVLDQTNYSVKFRLQDGSWHEPNNCTWDVGTQNLTCTIEDTIEKYAEIELVYYATIRASVPEGTNLGNDVTATARGSAVANEAVVSLDGDNYIANDEIIFIGDDYCTVVAPESAE